MTAAPSRRLPITIRPASPGREMNYVMSSWSQAAIPTRPFRITEYDRQGRPQKVELQSEKLYFEGHAKALVPRLIHRSTVLVAESDRDPGVIVGWLVFDPASVHFAYTTKAFRRMGVFRALVNHVPRTVGSYSHWAPVVSALPIPASWIYDETQKWR